MEEDDFGLRMEEQVTTLSTKLVTEVAKSSELEEALLQARKEMNVLKTKAQNNAATLEEYEKSASRAQQELEQKDKIYQQLVEKNSKMMEQYEQISKQMTEKYEQLQKEYQTLQQEKTEAENKNKQLEGEVEDLTASLFNEANEMVSNASREAYNFKLKNRKLFEELEEKDSIIVNLQDELRDLKELFIKMEDSARNSASSRTNTPKMGTGFDNVEEDASRKADYSMSNENLQGGEFADDEVSVVLNQIIYGPKTSSLRLDLPQYQYEFKAFIYQIIRKDFVFDLASLKTSKYFKKIWASEIEPSLGSAVPTLSGATFMNRWTKGKSFWSVIVEGKAVIEPVAGVNETFKLSYRGTKAGNAVPVALRESCGICGESKDDLLEHARLYTLKLYLPAVDSGYRSGNATINIAGEPHDIVGNYPLCNYCLVKLRAICDFFAKLRSIHSNIYKLSQNSSFEAVVPANGFQFKRASTESFQGAVANAEDEPIFIKLYLMLLVLRAKIFWAGVGFWDTPEDIQSLDVDDIKSDVFGKFMKENVAFSTRDLQEVHKTGNKDEEPRNSSVSVGEAESMDKTDAKTRKTESNRRPVPPIPTPANREEKPAAESGDKRPVPPLPDSAVKDLKEVSPVPTKIPVEDDIKGELLEVNFDEDSQKKFVSDEVTEEEPVFANEEEKPAVESDVEKADAKTSTIPQESSVEGNTNKGKPKKSNKKASKTGSNAAEDEKPSAESSQKASEIIQKLNGDSPKRDTASAKVQKVQDEEDTASAKVQKVQDEEDTASARVQKGQDEEDPETDEFQDTSQDFGETPLTRRKSKSKAFKKKMNKDLENTLSMLQESIE